MIVYGAGMADSNAHASDNLPVLLAGGGASPGGRHVRHPADTPLANLHLSLLDRLAWLADRLGPDLLDAAVITTGHEAYRRADGIDVIPAGLLTA